MVGVAWVQLYACDVDAVAHSIVDKGFGYLDRKYILQVRSADHSPGLRQHPPTRPACLLMHDRLAACLPLVGGCEQGKGSECGPLKLAVTTTQPGPIILCSPPGNEVLCGGPRSQPGLTRNLLH